ncbi:MAG: Mur ligase domain-containing protein, partial [Phycisphaerales bacterium]|nr:Mur ligase domain-containing protein [Phycisphaerales bacterium]
MTPTIPLPFSADAIHGKTFHFIGIGGCGMSGLAQIIQRLGGTVQGTDAVESAVTDHLIQLEIP